MKKLIIGLIAAVFFASSAEAAALGGVNRIFQGEYPDYNSDTPAEYIFKIENSDKEFILLDDEDGFFVLTKDAYGMRAFDPNGTQKFDPEDGNNIAYWLNHDFLEKGNGSAMKLPDNLIKYIDTERMWDTEAGVSDGNCPEGYSVQCGVALMSQTEWRKYYKRFGVRDDITGNGWWLRTPRAIGGGKNIVMEVELTSMYIGGTFGTWHCGDGKGKFGITNSNSIGIEICINSDGNYNIAFQNAVELTKHLMKELNIPVERVVRHYDASRKNCPARGNMASERRVIYGKNRNKNQEKYA